MLIRDDKNVAIAGESYPDPPFPEEPALSEDSAAYRQSQIDGYAQRLFDTNARLNTAIETVAALQQRLTQLEVFAHNQRHNQEVAKEIAERQTRYSALDLAIKASGPGAGGDVMTALAEGFLTWLRGQVH